MSTRTDADIVRQTNELARQFYAIRGYVRPDGYRFDRATHPHEQEAWACACLAQRELTETDPEDALEGMDED